MESKGLTEEIFDGNEDPDFKAAALDMVYGIIVALAAMTIFALVVPMYRVVHGFPCGNDLRLLCNWILPLVALVMIIGFAARLRNKASTSDGSYTSLLPKVDTAKILFFKMLTLLLTAFPNPLVGQACIS